MSTNWRNWCRLCAKDYDVFFKLQSLSELSMVVQKYFMISISPYDEAPTAICSECYKFISKLDSFALRCIKVEKMFAELVYDKINILENELQTVRYKFGIDEEEKYTGGAHCSNNQLPVIDFILKVDQSTDTIDLLSEECLQIKEENVIDIVIAPNKKKRGRPKKGEHPKTDVVAIKEEEEPKFESDVDIYDCDDHEDDTSFENDLDVSELQEELDELTEEINLNSSSPELNKRDKKRARKEREMEEISCPICDKSFNRRRQYEHHMRTKHSKDEMPFVCSKCPKRFGTEKKVKLHEAIHLPKSLKMVHPCPYCDKKFSKAVNVQAHVRAVHIGDRPFICEECGKSFGTKGALKEHQITHSDERPYQCAYCPKKFKNLPRLKTHEDIHNDTVYVCPHCGLQLNTKRTLKMHMVVHSDQKKYKCHYCGNEYKRSKALKNHLILHTGLRPYVCPFCDKTFANGSNCRSHKKKSHPLELAAMEAAGEVQRATNIPKLEHLQPKTHQLQQQIQDLMESVQNSTTTPKIEDMHLKSSTVSQIMESPSSTPHSIVTAIPHIVHNGIQHNLIGIMPSEQTLIMHVQTTDLQHQSHTPLIPTSNL